MIKIILLAIPIITTTISLLFCLKERNIANRLQNTKPTSHERKWGYLLVLLAASTLENRKDEESITVSVSFGGFQAYPQYYLNVWKGSVYCTQEEITEPEYLRFVKMGVRVDESKFLK